MYTSGRIEVNQNNLAYITVLFPESEIVRKHLREPRPRLKTLASSLSEDSPTHSSYNTLLSSHAVPSEKQQILFLYVLVSCTHIVLDAANVCDGVNYVYVYTYM